LVQEFAWTFTQTIAGPALASEVVWYLSFPENVAREKLPMDGMGKLISVSLCRIQGQGHVQKLSCAEDWPVIIHAAGHDKTKNKYMLKIAQFIEYKH